MCGILGAVPIVDRDTFSLSLSTLKHRGPDGSAIFIDAENAILGHSRLSIIDLSAMAAQPMELFNRYSITFNGEIYNYIELKRNLECLGFTFRTSSDTEVLLTAYVHWGPECLNKLNGMWAFAIWDRVEQELFFSRDRLGEKPFYYTRTNKGGFIFSSEQKALLPFINELAPNENFDKLVKYQYHYSATPNTLFSQIFSLPPGHMGTLKQNRVSIKRYWVPQKRDLGHSYEELVSQFQDLIKDSCALRMRSDVAVCSALSGGIDSSVIASFLKPASNIRNKTSYSCFTANFSGSHSNETMRAQQISEHLGIKLTLADINFNNLNLPDELEKNAYMFEDVSEVCPLSHFLLYRKMRESNLTVSLDGHGGDELFCGYESSILHALLERGMGINHFKNIWSMYQNVHLEGSDFIPMGKKSAIIYLLAQSIREKNRTKFSDPEFYTFYDGLSNLNKHLALLTFKSVLPTLLRNYDRYSMASGVEVRSPLLDHRIVEFAFSLNAPQKLNGYRTKAILRDSVNDSLPRNIHSFKAKLGFAPPVLNWIRGPLSIYLLDEINSVSFLKSDLINPYQLKRQISGLILGKQNIQQYDAEAIWKQFSIYLWEKVFFNK